MNKSRTLFLEPGFIAAKRLNHKMEKALILCDLLSSHPGESAKNSKSDYTVFNPASSSMKGEISYGGAEFKNVYAGLLKEDESHPDIFIGTFFEKVKKEIQ